MGYGQGRTPLGIGVYFREDHCVNSHGLVELLGLLHRIVPRESVTHEYYHVGLRNPLYLLHLVHEVGVGLHPPGSVYQDHILVPGLGMLHRIERHSGRVAPRLLLYHLYAELVAVNRYLLDGSGPECISGGHDRCQTHLFQAVCNPGDGCGLSTPVHPNEHENNRLFALFHE